jgi:hypothetical protein
MDVASMSEQELNQAIIAKEKEVRALRAEQFELHQEAERKRKLHPIIPNVLDQVIGHHQDIGEWLKNLPADIVAKIKQHLGGPNG